MARDYSGKRGNGRSGGNGRGRASASNGHGNAAGRNKRPRRQPTRGTPGWVWLFFGLTVGLLVAIGIYIATRPTGGVERLVGQPLPIEEPPAITASPATAPALPPKQDPRFSFYDMLPKYEIVIPQVEYRSPEQKANPEVNNPGLYLIQVASFRDYGDADTMKARLALLGIEADIREATLASGETWYRVRIGPEQDTDRINTILARLQDNQIDSMLMRVNREG